jgi:hypothetical protein
MKLYIVRKSVFIFFIVILVSMCYLPFSTNAQSKPEINQFYKTLEDIKKAVNESNKALALDLLDKAFQILQRIEESPVIDEEALRWDIAQLNLERAEEMVNEKQKAKFANKSIEKWLEYVLWYQNLNDSHKRSIKDRPNSYRIQRAARQLGLALITRGNWGSYSISELFDIYIDLPYSYLSSYSINLWAHWLFRCSKWEESSNNSFRGLKSKFKDGKNVCKDNWEDFTNYLEQWLVEQKLIPNKKIKYQRWLKDLKYALDR